MTPADEVPALAGHLDNYDLTYLVNQRNHAEDEKAAANARIAEIDAEFVRRFGSTLYGKLKASDKETGSVTAETEDGFKLKGEVSKTVKWDSGALQTVAMGMSWEEIQHYFKIAFSVPEAIYKAIPPSKLKDALTKARTVKPGDLKVKVERAE